MMPRGEGALLVAKTWRNAGLVTQPPDAPDRCPGPMPLSCHERRDHDSPRLQCRATGSQAAAGPRGYYSMLP